MSHPKPVISRRDFLKLAGAAALSVAWNHRPGVDQPPFGQPLRLGRTTWPLHIYARPSFLSKRLGGLHDDDLIVILEQAIGDSFPHNPIWFRMDQGWVQSSSVQVVQNILNQPVRVAPPGGFLAEVTVPMTPTWRVPGERAGVPAYFYYSAVFWVDQVTTDANGQVWYRVVDDLQVPYFVRGEHLRPIPEAELAPVSPAVSDKRIEISLQRQRLVAYENGQAVFSCKVASGLPGTETPSGAHRVLYKRPSRHMATGVDVVGPAYNLPGVPWCSYFTQSGAALHGTYWHNDFGRRNSAGCVNLLPENAKWLYRWTLPTATGSDHYLPADNGTPVLVA